MERISDTKSLEVTQQDKSNESHAGLKRTDSKTKSDEKFVVEDGSLISNLGWITILSVTIAGITMGGIGASL